MSIVDLSRRITTDWDTFNRYKASPDSYVFVNEAVRLPDDSKVALDLSVGKAWYDARRETFVSIPTEGLKIPARSAVVIETAQKITVPFNMFGIVTGKGHYIFQSVIVSPGKIDPGFNDHLRIGVYNASDSSLLLRTSDLFCSCCFFSLESWAELPVRVATRPPTPEARLPFLTRCKRFWSRHWDKVLMICLTGLSCLAAVATAAISYFR